MFAIFYGLLSLFGYTGSKIQNGITNIRKENETTGEYYGKKMWIDSKGRWRDSATGECLTIGTIHGDPSGHLYILDSHRKPVKDITQDAINEREKENREKCIEKNHMAYQIGIKDDYHVRDKCKGLRYKNVKTGEIYVVRKWKYEEFYMNIQNGMFVSVSDDNIQVTRNAIDISNKDKEMLWNKFIKDTNKIIEEQNERQRNFIEKYGHINYLNEYDPNDRLIHYIPSLDEIF